MNTAFTVFIAGDSTAAIKQPDRRPETGWGEKLEDFLDKSVAVRDFAVNGRSSKSFIDEGRLKNILADIRKDDYLLIEFGHNDEKEREKLHTDPYTTYQSTLAVYIEKARESGAIPIFLTPIQRRQFHEDGTIKETHGEYPSAMKQLAVRMNVPLIDMSKITKDYFEQLGPENSRRLFLWLKPGESPNYPDGNQDNTHLNEYGAKQIAGLVARGIKKLNLEPISKLVIEKTCSDRK